MALVGGVYRLLARRHRTLISPRELLDVNQLVSDEQAVITVLRSFDASASSSAFR